MKKMKKLAVVAALALASIGFGAGCGAAMVAEGPVGMLYQGTKTPVSGVRTSGTKVGKACAISILGAIAIGDASVSTAAMSAGIQEIGTVDSENFAILGIFAQQCTVVRGN